MSAKRAPRIPPYFRSRFRFGAFFTVWVLTTIVAGAWLDSPRAFILGFDAGAAAYIALTAALMAGASPATMRKLAASADASRVTLLIVAGLVISTIMAMLTIEVLQRNAPGAAGIATTLATLPIAWLFSNLVYAVHYAHLYYGRDDGGEERSGIAFPNAAEPDYWDFCYFAMTLGMTFQTSDIEIENRTVRRVALGQCLLAFAFNIGVVALSVNVLSGS